MVITNIIGGIGNQMFQYAAGRSLSLLTGQQYLLDLNDFSKYRLHNGFELGRVFNVVPAKADVPTLHRLLRWRAPQFVKKVLKRPQFGWLRGKTFVVEPHFNYWSGLNSLTGNCYLYGYWQSEQYFKSVESVIRRDFDFREPLVGVNADLASEIQRFQSISLHVRRGDYISDTKTRSIMDICSLDYYLGAIKHIADHVDNPIFFIFSDDMAWVKENLMLNYDCIYVSHNRGAESYRDMQLMSLCKHHIIANSSFSWWGAWLNPNSEKIVVAPKIWFRNGMDDSDLIPKEWVRL